MPTIHLLNSIKIKLYYNDHLPPHFHAEYNEYEVLIEIQTLKIYAGELPNKQMKSVLKWATDNQDGLLAKWNEFTEND